MPHEITHRLGDHRGMLKVIGLILLLAAYGWAQQPKQSKTRPPFAAFKAEQEFTGAPAAPKLNQSQRTFRTMIREGAKARVEFGGHYTVPRWGCGAGCSMFVIADSIAGTVYDGFAVADLPLTWMEKHGEQPRIEFHPTSRLLKINGCINEKNCGFYDYAMTEGKGLKLVRKELLPKEFQ